MEKLIDWFLFNDEDMMLDHMYDKNTGEIRRKTKDEVDAPHGVRIIREEKSSGQKRRPVGGSNTKRLVK